jgi:hypothetical protein
MNKREMIIFYYTNNELWLDFDTIYECVSDVPKVTLWRRLKKCNGVIEYRNRKLYKVSELVNLKDIYSKIEPFIKKR